MRFRPALSLVRQTLTLALLGASALAQAEDVRRQPLKDLNGYFPFNAPQSLQDWQPRRDYVRRQIAVSQGLWPMPTKTPLNAVVHGRMEFDDYVVEKVYFESAPGFYVTGNLYRPKHITGKVPAVLFPHGHWKDARFLIQPEKHVLAEISTGQERFENGGQSRFQSMCVQLARMGCIAWHYDALSDSDSIQFSPAVIHSFAKQRPEMNRTENWGLYSPQAEANLQSVMGLQTLNSVRGVDFLLSLPEVDPARIAVTGSSGGGTQTMLLAAVDDRVNLSYPVVMVSTAMQGGCSCENCSLLRVNSGNVEIAAVFAPKPQGMNTANDWTKEMATKGFPDLQKLYALYGRKNNVALQRGEHFPHNYNAVTRMGFFDFLNAHFKLGLKSPVIERDYTPLPKEKLTVWDADHPAPKAADPDFERGLLKWLRDDAQKQLASVATSREGLEKVVRPAVEVLIGRTYALSGKTAFVAEDTQREGALTRIRGKVINSTYGEEVAVEWLSPANADGRAVLWLGDTGSAALRDGQSALLPEVRQLLDAGVSVIGSTLLFQDDTSLRQARVVPGPREVPAYTFCYNHALFAQRTHDVLTLVRFLHGAQAPGAAPVKSVALAAWGKTGPIAAAARALAGPAVTRAAVDTQGFRFASLLDYRDPMFLPGGAKYLDVPGLLALNAPHALWVAGEGAKPALVSDLDARAVTAFSGPADQKASDAVRWLLSPR